jgi:hypothetical protein
MIEGCGTCTLCCKIMKVEQIEKPAHTWCRHCEIGKGCGVYDARPEQCRDWSCFWLQSQARDDRDRMSPSLRPDRSHVIFDGITDKDTGDYAARGLAVYVDPAYPSAWRRVDVAAVIGRAANNGLRVIVATGAKRKLIARGDI